MYFAPNGTIFISFNKNGVCNFWRIMKIIHGGSEDEAY